jgi:formamidopyrimidine-DNA glycosylase
MPELPEVETVRRGLEPCLVRRRLHAVELRRRDLRWPLPAAALQRLCGAVCERVTRRAKYLLLHFSSGSVVLAHLGMTGQLFVERGRGVPPEWQKHEHWRMVFDRRLVRYVDARRFGVLDVVASADLEHHKLLRSLGPEPLEDDFSAEYLFRRTRGRTASLKSFVMDARNVVGIGNIYASEACFRAGLRPGRAAGRLTREECARLVTAAREVLMAAIHAGGTTISDYVGVSQDIGAFQHELRVYGRGGEPCGVCGTSIRRRVDGARATFFCTRCQR